MDTSGSEFADDTTFREFRDSLRTGKRIDFSAVARMDPEEKKDHIDAKLVQIRRAFQIYVQRGNTNEHIPALPQKAEEVFRTIAETLVEASEVLGFEVDPYFEFYRSEEGYVGLMDPDEQIINPARVVGAHLGLGIIGYNIEELYEVAEIIRSSPYRADTDIPDRIRSAIAAEMAHVYVARHFPTTNARSLLANEATETGNMDLYRNDRGEKYTELFAQQYVDYKHQRS